MIKSNKAIIKHLNDFLDWLEIEKGLSSKSQENYSIFLKRFLDWLKENNLEELKPHQLTPEHVWKYRGYLARQYSPKNKKNSLKKSTQNYYLIALRSLLNFFADRDIQAMPAEKIKLARKKGSSAVNFLNLSQLKSLFQAPDTSKIQGLRDRAILEVFFSTGMRIAELTSLNRDQVKLKKDTKDLEIVIIGKGSKPRPVYFSERAVHWLRKYLQARKDKEKPLFINYKNKTSDSRRLSPRSIQKKIKRYSVKAGIPLTTTPHTLRHSFATDLLQQGVDLRTLQEFLGHNSPLATQIYTHVTNKRLKDIHRKFHSK